MKENYLQYVAFLHEIHSIVYMDEKRENELLAEIERFRRKDRRFERAEELSGMGYWGLDPTTGTIDWSDNYFRLLGYEPGEVEPSEEMFESHIHPADRERVAAAISSAISKKEDTGLEFRFVTKQGETRWGHSCASLILDDDGEIVGYDGFLRDITDMKETEERFQQLFDNMTNGVAIYRPVDDGSDFEFVDINRAGQELSTVRKEDVVGKRISETFPAVKEMGLLDILRRVYRTDTPETIPLTEYRDDRIVEWVENYVFKIPSGLVVVIYEDISEKQRTEEELIRAKELAEESDALKTAFLANMSHELRTPMNGIMGFADMLDEPDITESKRKSYIKIINDSCRKLLSIVNDILDISMLETGQVNVTDEEVRVNDVLMDVYSFFKPGVNETNVAFYTSAPLPDNQAVIRSDPTRLRQILNSLTDNAIKFTHRGHIRIGYKVKDGDIVFYVEDTGIGIPEHLHDTIFERFRQADVEYTRQYGGTGLGLTITKNLVELLGGTIWLKSTPGRGSIFYFDLPAEIEHPTTRSLPEAAGDAHGTDSTAQGEPAHTKEEAALPTVLVAEDDAINFLYIENLLRRRDITVIHAKNGKDAVDAVRQDPKIGLVLMDIKMPVMNGYEATEQIQAMRPELPVVALTAFAMPEDMSNAKERGFSGYIPKPFEQATLESTLDKFLGK